MGWTAPRTWVAGEIVTAALGNAHWRDNLRYLKGLDGVPTIESGLTIDNTDGDERLLLPLLSTAECSTVLNAEGEVAFDEQTHTPKYYNGSAIKDIGDHGSLGGLLDDDHTQYMQESVFDSDADGRITKDAMQWTAAKLLLGAGAGSDPTEIDVPIPSTVVTGNYTGNQTARQITTGMKCSMVVIISAAETAVGILIPNAQTSIALAAGPAVAGVELHASDGFSLPADVTGAGFNINATVYYYWAISE